MTPTLPSDLDVAELQVVYDQAAQDYFDSLPLEHFMEAMRHATQRKITLESFDVIHARRPDIQCFSELLVQYPRPGQDSRRPGQVVPDNMVIIHQTPIERLFSYSTVHQPGPPLLVLEYVSKSSKQKDYVDNLQKYELELKVPYYLLFDLDEDKLHLFQLADDGYQPVEPNENGRFAIPDLELEAALHDGWVRYWFRDELIPLPAELIDKLDQKTAELEAEKRAASSAATGS